MKRSAKWFINRFAILALCATLLIPLKSVTAAQGKNNLVLDYTVYAGGVNALSTRITLDQTGSKYDFAMDAQTHGLLGRLAPWSGRFSSNGKIEKKVTLVPKTHESVSVWRGKKEIKTYSYNRDGSFNGLKIIEEGEDKSPSDLDPKLVDQTTDIMSATLQMLNKVDHENICEGRSDIFDGKRRFELSFHDEGETVLKKNRYNIFEGAARKCRVEVTPIAGKWHEKPRGWLAIQEQGRDKGTLPTVWVGKLAGTDQVIPIKVRVKTDYGTLFMHLVDVANQTDLNNEQKYVEN